MPNRLENASSPYLRQHKNNPVDWYPWGQEALDKAKSENKPIFLSIGYSACHWCHVMAHESFEDPYTASLLNAHFISIKVDREEHPDLDEIYMRAVVSLAGQGGWPMSVFLTPNLEPFYGGTYFPPIPSYGMPSFTQILRSVIDVWENDPQAVQNNARIITNEVRAQFEIEANEAPALDLDNTVEDLNQNYDWRAGGWGKAPKFPQAMVIQFLIQRAFKGDLIAKKMATHALDHMAHGGMHDLVGGGFHRYSTDADWLVPHFEKMLYDNALLAQAYLHGFALTGNPYYKKITIATLDFILREMTHPNGGFFASLDADTSAGEGRYYVWRKDEIERMLSIEQFSLLQNVIEFPQNGHFKDDLLILRYKDNPQILAETISISDEELLGKLSEIFSILREHREKLTPPAKDDKIITSWNGLAVTAFAEAGLLLEKDDYLLAAKRALNFLLDHLQVSNGVVMRSWSRDKANHPGTLEDYAGLFLALHSVYEIDFNPFYFGKMKEIVDLIQFEFSGEDEFYYDTSIKRSDLIIRPRNLQDNATPAGNALAAHAHWLLAQLDHDRKSQERFEGMVKRILTTAHNYPTGFGYWLRMADLMQSPAQQIAMVSNGDAATIEPLIKIYRKAHRPYSIIAAKFEGMDRSHPIPSLLDDRPVIDDLPTAYICVDHTCKLPITDIHKFKSQLEAF